MDKLIWLYPYLDTIKIESGKELFHHYRIMETSHSLKTLKPPLHITMQSPPPVCKDWILKKQTKICSGILIEKMSVFFFVLLSAFTLIMRIMTSPKNFEKIAILKIWWLVFF